MTWDDMDLDTEEVKAEAFAIVGCFVALCAGAVVAVVGLAALGWWLWANADKAWSVLR